ncbi:serine/threonine protein phosphatase 2A 57 kDa regulatory subunit B' kappa isoform-like [Cynara cardunculus var. scolymus]|uniref:Serine/threonine protein phosphatase 2A regulatory subunit n=1 Tax=Cynara cardunculus var. scolymus TaxID=59895 RepID=A0A103YM64_CYNCS|nr:serine/threonine protein phosphatase 2A 57 kDa regulatory subunit B' kappa isoform-like [Cynara cardunculus var. scolymus]KVI11624.1 Armadillo-type fold [Cynara cardunculus var. scolymus]
MSIFGPETAGLLLASNSTISTMIKQFLAKIPRKSSKANATDADGGSSSSSVTTDVGNNGFINTYNAISSRLNTVKKMSSSIFPASIMPAGEMIDPQIPFKDVQNSEKLRLLISKLNLCSKLYDFQDQAQDSVEKDIKRQTLVEIIDFLSSESAKLSEPAMFAICKMCGNNLFRDFPPKNSVYSPRGETEDEEPSFDPAWSHLHLVYEILLRFLSQTSLDPKVAKQYIDHSFILRLLDLFDTEDPRERDCLKAILHRVYGKFMVHRPFIRMVVSNIIYRFVFETEKHNGIAELLEIFGSVISGFALPLKKEHKMFLLRALVPLHKPKSVGVYHHQLTYCIVQFIEKEPKLSSAVIMGLLKFWPVTSSQKQLMFLSELEELLEMIHTDEFEKVMVPLFRRIDCCLRSSHFQVAERAHFLWNNEHVLHLIMYNRQVIMPLVFSSLERNSQTHWSRTVLNLAQNMMKMLNDVDQELVVSCQGQSEEDKSTSTVVAERRRLTWERLENIAAFQPVVGNVSILEETAPCIVSC